MDQPAISALPLFPLSLVLLPGQSMPLHVFEPRYRAMLARAMDTDQLIGFPTPMAPPPEGSDQPVLYPLFGVGRVCAHRELEDGRSYILVQYAGCARMVEELPLDPGGFRVARGEWIPEVTGPVPQGPLIKALLSQLLPEDRTVRTSFERLSERDPAEMLCMVADMALGDLTDRLAFLEARSQSDRGALVHMRLAERLTWTGQPVGEA